MNLVRGALRSRAAASYHAAPSGNSELLLGGLMAPVIRMSSASPLHNVHASLGLA